MTDGEQIAGELKQQAKELSQSDFDLLIKTLAEINYEQYVRGLVHLEGGQLPSSDFDEWLHGEAGLLDTSLIK